MAAPAAAGPSIILHVDMNAFFASVEQRSNPLLRGKPIAVVGDLHRRSVILTASYEARRFGVKTGMLYYEGKKLCPALIPVENDSRKYMDVSGRIFQLFGEFTDRIEMTSCDEAFLDVSNGQPFGIRGPELAERIQKKIQEDLSLPCSVGVAANRTLAKLASDAKKPRGLTVVAPEDVGAFLKDMPVEKLCGIGEKMRRNLEALGIRTCGELGAAPFETLYTRFGAWGHWLGRMGRGEDASAMWGTSGAAPVKSVGHSMTFAGNTDNDDVIRGYLFFLAEKVGRRMRHYGLSGSGVSVMVRYGDFETVGRQKRFSEASCDDLEIYKRAGQILERFRPFRMAVRLLSVSVYELTSRPPSESLWGEEDKDRRRRAAMDWINDKYGRLTLYHGRVQAAREHGLHETPIPPRGRSPLSSVIPDAR